MREGDKYKVTFNGTVLRTNAINSFTIRADNGGVHFIRGSAVDNGAYTVEMIAPAHVIGYVYFSPADRRYYKYIGEGQYQTFSRGKTYYPPDDLINVTELVLEYLKES